MQMWDSRYEPYEILTRKGFNFVSLGNILIGGAVGMLIDYITGGFFTVNPDPINVKMEIQEDKSTIKVIENMSLEMRQSLTQIGQLTKKI